MVAFLLFYRLDMRTFQLWDEARLAVNSAYMLIDKNYYYTIYQNTPDFWNTKPHLLILFQVLSMKIFGFSEGSIRLPSAIAAFLNCVLIYYWIKQENYPFLYGCLAIFVFLSTSFLRYHGARAGDYESLLILWELSYCYAFFKYMQSQQQQFLWYGFILLTLAVLTKGIAGLLFIPGIVIFVFFKRKMEFFLKSKSFYFGMLIFILCIIGYYWLHEILTPGYLENVYNNEIAGRYFKVIEGHNQSWWFYFDSFSLTNFYFLPILLGNIVYLLSDRKILYQNLFLQYIVTLCLTFFLIISFSKTKIGWYAYPIYPFIGIFIAVLSNELSKFFDDAWRNRWIKFIILWMIIAYIASVVTMLASTLEEPNITSFLKNNLKYDIPHDYKIIVDNDAQYTPFLDFYREKYLAETHCHLKKSTFNQLNNGDWVIMRNDQANKIDFSIHVELYTKDKNFGVYRMKVR
jgi:4-amino-4-deoxy-L-arabinose transferase-like glycosyltransferase